jgi:hypothetical protein
VAQRHPDAAAVERVGRRGIQQHRGHPEGRGVAEQRADVLVVGQPLGDDDQPCACQHTGDPRERSPSRGGEHAAVERKAGDRFDLCVGPYDHRRPATDEGTHPLRLALRRQHRADREVRTEQRLQGQRALDHEESAPPLHVPP